MTIDNLLVNIPPSLIFALGACLRAHLGAVQTAEHAGMIILLQMLFGYVFDASNQSRDTDEDRINKPHRPVPSGLITPAGARRRFWCVMPVYTLVGWAMGVVEWVLLFQAVVTFLNLLCPPRAYLWCKTPCMILGVVAQLAAAWQSVAPIDSTAWRWILIIAVPFCLALPFEDVRDMAGDHAIGRRTPALVLGEWPLRVWFAGLLAWIPLALHYALFLPTHASGPRILLCDTALAIACWTPALRALLLRNTAADRLTYQLLITAYIIMTLTTPALWY
ncbi:UbiA family prenyltransferase [Actinomadura sp. NEAU-AAG7]|uniref:UbiA family prenyltransferase n=1 Tax=Actinomadura sp. NEAU-AAG7 TaxID=2839640 RepID=UPI001BE420DE|nr:UbiA family prenyltransferase [Actinomadura sp. NEAU-AAG7]MBT2207720.1 UbiA family prenyltransferase [Actinomadura sp. NEAU-AAG7]